MADVPTPAPTPPNADAIKSVIFASLSRREDAPQATPTAPTTSARRIVVVKRLHHFPATGQPKWADASYARPVDTDEEPYGPRRTRIGPDWTPLDAGWLNGSPVSMLILSNEEGKGLQTIPTDAERVDIAGRVVEVGIVPPPPADRGKRTMFSEPLPPSTPIAFALVRPGEEFDLDPADVAGLRVRCRSGSALCYLTVFPG